MLISVVIATYNRCSFLKQVLDQLLAQQVPHDVSLEFLVVDNNSKDDTRKVVESFVPLFAGRLRYFFESRQGKPFALNRGIAESGGEIVAFTDDDVNVDPKWLSNIVECFNANHCDCVGGRVLPVYPDGAPPWIKDNPRQAAGTVVIYDYGESTQKFDGMQMDLFIGANFAFRREIFTECGLFRSDLVFGKVAVGEDHEFLRRLLKKHKSLFYCGQALVWHPVNLERLRLKQTARWHIALGKFAARMEAENEGKKFNCINGVPRYILKRMATDFFCMILNSFDKLKFFKYYRSFFCCIGMIREYRKQRNR